MTTVTDALTQTIMRVDDPEKTLPAGDLARELLGTMPPFFANQHGADFVDFVERTDPDRQMDECCLAELIVAEFGLDRVA